jgi:hypothetical protein
MMSQREQKGFVSGASGCLQQCVGVSPDAGLLAMLHRLLLLLLLLLLLAQGLAGHQQQPPDRRPSAAACYTESPA